MGTFQEVYAICQTIFLTIYHPLDARLDNQFGTLYTGRCGDVDGSTFAVIVRTARCSRPRRRFQIRWAFRCSRR